MHRLFREGLFEESIDISSRNTFHVSPGVLSLERGNFFTSQYAIPLPFHFCSHFFPSFLFLFSAGNFGKTWTITVTSSPPRLLPYRVTHIPREAEENRAPTNFTLDAGPRFIPSSFIILFLPLISVPPSKFRTSTLRRYYLSHNKFIVRRVIIMPSCPATPNDITAKSFVTVEMEKRFQ